jgi:hypothetical protein
MKLRNFDDPNSYGVAPLYLPRAKAQRTRRRRKLREQIVVYMIWSGIVLSCAVGFLLFCTALWIVWPS